MRGSGLGGKNAGQLDRLRGAEYDVFFSRDAADTVLVDAAATRIAATAIRVYADRVEDEHLDRVAVTRATAGLLRALMRRYRLLVLAVTCRSAASLWITGELSHFDNHAGEFLVLPDGRFGTRQCPLASSWVCLEPSPVS